MLKILFVLSLGIFSNAFSQTAVESSTQSTVEEKTEVLPGSSGGAYSVRTRKKAIKAPAVIAPVENHVPASCADSLGGKGSANFTACEAAKKTR